jgi:threonine dehydrogenase-like Zn-dependent dehydrogenase
MGTGKEEKGMLHEGRNTVAVAGLGYVGLSLGVLLAQRHGCWRWTCCRSGWRR